MKNKILIFIWIFLLSLHLRAEVFALGFDDIPRLVSERNQHSQGARKLKESADAARGYLRRSFYPHLQAGIGQDSFKTGSQERDSQPYGTVGARVNLYNGGRDSKTDEIADVRALGASAESDHVYRDEVRKARQNYWHLVSQREVALLIEQAIEQNQLNLKAAKVRIRAGIATDTDRIDFEMHQIELEQDLARLRLASQNTERNLAILLGLSGGNIIETPPLVGHTHQDELLTGKYDATENPALSSLRSQALRAELESSQSRRWWQPSMDVYARYGLYTFPERSYLEQSERYESVIGVQLTLDLFDRGTGSTNARVKALEAQGLKLSLDQGVRELNAQIEGARAELKLTHELVHKSEDAIERARTYLKRTLDEYRRGVKNSPDVLSASERNIEMRRRFAELRRDYQLARAELLAILGK
jgi:outer membrane protein